jgi:hypothetical protein
VQRETAVTGLGRVVPLQDLPPEPDIKLSVRQSFGVDSDLQVPAFSQTTEYVPEIDDAYRFDRDTTLPSELQRGSHLRHGLGCHRRRL